MSALVTLCDREYSFVWLPMFISNVYRDISCDFTKDAVSNYLFYLSLFPSYLFYKLQISELWHDYT